MQYDFFAISKNIFLRKSNFQKHVKSDFSDTNGRRKRDFHVENSHNEVGEIDFRYTGTNFATFFNLFDPRLRLKLHDRRLTTTTAPAA